MDDQKRKELVLTTVAGLAGHFMLYDREDDEELPVGAIQKLITNGTLTVDEIMAHFRCEIEDALGDT